MKNKRIIFGIILPVLAMVCVAYLLFGRREQPAKDLDHVTLRLSWIPSVFFAGEYVAEEKGFFKEKNIEVAILPGGPGLDIIDLVEGGGEDISTSDIDRLMIAREKGRDVVLLAAKYQQTPACFFVKTDSDIRSPSDFVGKTVGIKLFTVIPSMLKIILQREGVKPEKVPTTRIGTDMNDFFSGAIPVWSGYTMNEPHLARKEGTEVRIFLPSDYGVDFYGTGFFTSSQTLARRRDVLMRFMETVKKGWLWAFDHPDDAVKIVLRKNPSLDPEEERRTLLELRPIIVGKSGNEFGKLDLEKLKGMEKDLRSIGDVEKPLDMASFVELLVR